MKDLDTLSALMRADWDRRIAHDYRFWMSDGHVSDEAMWQSGERDFALMCDGLQIDRSLTFLELGCGVGRILRAALSRFGRVIGVDVSAEAISKAAQMLPASPQLQLVAGNGVDLHQVADGSVDVALSYAALTSMPTDVIALYLTELSRVLKPGGYLRLQVYIGKEQEVRRTDTLNVRCFDRSNLEAALRMCGFSVQWLKELALPFQVSDQELGFEATIVALQKAGACTGDAASISETLLPGGEDKSGEIAGSDDLEYWIAVNYACELAERGEVEEAERALTYAAQFTGTVTIDVRDLLDRVAQTIERAKVGMRPQSDAARVAGAPTPSLSPTGSAALFARNIRVLQARFPKVAARVLQEAPQPIVFEVRSTAEGPALFVDGQCLDHPTKPVSGAAAWAARTLKEERCLHCKALTVLDFGLGYHVEALMAERPSRVSAIVPTITLLRIALEHRDVTACLERIAGLEVGDGEWGSCFDQETELVLRPQAALLAPDLCSQVRARFYGARGVAALHPQIGVLGPIQGGTLPIMNYTSRALALNNQRVRELDTSEFAAGYHAVGKFIHNDLLKNNAQGSYVEMISKLVLQSLTEKPVDILICMALAPITGEVLTELRRRGVITVLWFVEDYMRFKTWEVLAPYFDFIFTIQKGECIEAIKKAGCADVYYLPTACDPFVHAPLRLTAEEQARFGSPVSFVGAGYHNRQQVFASLAKLPFKIWGTEWPECKPFDRLVQEQGRRLKPEEYVKIFNASQININLHSSTERDGVDPSGDFINPRTFELCSSGAFQLVDPRSLLNELFTPGQDLATFTDTIDLKEKIDYYLAHDEERLAVARRGRETALRRHTYQHRLMEMLSIIYSKKFETLKRRADASPWKMIIDRSRPYPELHQRCEAAFRRGEEPGLDALVSDIVTGDGSLTETEQKLLFLFHVSKQIIRAKKQDMGIEN